MTIYIYIYIYVAYVKQCIYQDCCCCCCWRSQHVLAGRNARHALAGQSTREQSASATLAGRAPTTTKGGRLPPSVRTGTGARVAEGGTTCLRHSCAPPCRGGRVRAPVRDRSGMAVWSEGPSVLGPARRGDAGLAGSVSGPPHPRLLGWTLAWCCLLLGHPWGFLTASKKDNPVLKILHTLGQSHGQAATSR